MSSELKTMSFQEYDLPTLMPTLRFPQFHDAGSWRPKELGECLDYLQPTKFLVNSTAYDDKYETPVVTAGKTFILGYTNETEGVFDNPLPVIIFDDFTTASQYVDFQFKAKSSAMKILLPKEDINIKFIYESMQKIKYEVGAHGRHWISSYSKIKVALPKTDEQKKIADCLSSIDDLIAMQTQKVHALKTHKKGLMQLLFPCDGETLPRLRFPEFRDAGEWECRTLKDIARITSGSTPLRSNQDFHDGGSIPWVKTTDLNNSLITDTEEKITPIARARINPVGSVLVAMYGGFNQIGRTGCLSIPAATNQALSVLVVNQEIALPVYVLAWLNAKVESWKKIASSSRKDPNITGSDVAKFPIKYPKTKEQQKIADVLTSLDEIMDVQAHKLEALKAHKKGLMQQLFPDSEDAA